VWFYQQYREEIIDLFSRYRLRVLPVVDIDDHLLGVIRQSTITDISGNILTNALNNCSLDSPFDNLILALGLLLRGYYSLAENLKVPNPCPNHI